MPISLHRALVPLLIPVIAGCGGQSAGSSAVSKTSALTSDVSGADGHALSDAMSRSGDAAQSTTMPPDVGSAPDYKFLSCTPAADCAAKACAPAFEPDCVATCLNDSDVAPVPLKLAQNLTTCIRKSCIEMDCKDNREKDCMEKCIDDFCVGDVMLCVDNGGFGDKECLGLGPCMGKCKLTGTNPFKCMGKCYNSLSVTAKGQAEVLGKCVKEMGIISKCCINTVNCGTNNKSGTKPCGYYMKSCTECATQWEPPPGQDQVGNECFFFCMAEVNAEGQQIFADQNAQGCHDLHEDHGEHTHPPSEACSQLFYKCLLHEIDGDMPCSGFDPCVQQCYATGKGGGARDFGGSSDHCSMECSGKLKKSSQKVWTDLSRCSWDCQAFCALPSAPQTCTSDCIAKTCGPQVAACQADK